jgi:DNA-directed RNA polymerase
MKDNKWATEGHRRATLLRAKKKLMGKLEIDQRLKLLIGAKCIELFINATGMVENLLVRNRYTRKDNYILTPTEKLSRYLTKAHSECELLQPVYFPMIVPPVDWTSPHGAGFLMNSGTLEVSLVKSMTDQDLLALAKTDLSRVYEALNNVQRTAWRINKRVAAVMQEIWERGGNAAGLPPRELPEFPRKPWEHTG